MRHSTFLKKHRRFWHVIIVMAIGYTVAQAQEGPQAPLGFEEYDPVSTLKVDEHISTRAQYPSLDLPSHQARLPTQDLSALLKQTDDSNMAITVNLSGRGFTRDWEQSTAHVKASIKSAEKVNPSRLVVLPNLVFA